MREKRSGTPFLLSSTLLSLARLTACSSPLYVPLASQPRPILLPSKIFVRCCFARLVSRRKLGCSVAHPTPQLASPVVQGQPRAGKTIFVAHHPCTYARIHPLPSLSKPSSTRIEAEHRIARTTTHTWAVIPPEQNISQHVEVLLSVDLAVDNLESLDQRGPFDLRVSPSSNGKLLALLNCTGLLWVVSTDFQRSLAESDIQTAGAEGPVNQVEWYGNDAIPVTRNNLALLVGTSGDTLQ